MMIKILDVLIILFIYFIIKWIIWYCVYENYYIPKFLDHLPFSCSDCLQTHSLWISYLSISYILDWNLTILIGGFGLTLLNTIAIWYDKKINTIK